MVVAMETVNKYSQIAWIFPTFLQSNCHTNHKHVNSLIITSPDIAKLNYLSNETIWATVSYLVPTILGVEHATELSKICFFHEKWPLTEARMLKITHFTMPTE